MKCCYCKLIGYTRGAVTIKGAVIYQSLRYPFSSIIWSFSVLIPKIMAVSWLPKNSFHSETHCVSTQTGPSSAFSLFFISPYEGHCEKNVLVTTRQPLFSVYCTVSKSLHSEPVAVAIGLTPFSFSVLGLTSSLAL